MACRGTQGPPTEYLPVTAASAVDAAGHVDVRVMLTVRSLTVSAGASGVSGDQRALRSTIGVVSSSTYASLSIVGVDRSVEVGLVSARGALQARRTPCEQMR